MSEPPISGTMIETMGPDDGHTTKPIDRDPRGVVIRSLNLEFVGTGYTAQ
jgi:hypothetical protein